MKKRDSVLANPGVVSSVDALLGAIIPEAIRDKATSGDDRRPAHSANSIGQGQKVVRLEW
jgi:hypothetical protein